MITKQSFQDFFHADYRGIETILQEILIPVFGEMERGYTEVLEADEALREQAGQNNIRSIRHEATFYVSGLDLKVFDVTIEDNCHIAAARKGIQTIVRKHVDRFEGAIIIFHYANPEGRSWRLSYLEKRQSNAASTNPKRYTYLCGSDYPCRTIAERFYTLQSKEKNAQTLQEAFSVEALSDEFFDEYKVFYEDIVQYISGTRFVEISKNKYERRDGFLHNDTIFAAFLQKNGNDRAGAEKMVRDYVKKLLGRLVFLQFLQKKGWMGVPAMQNDWTGGDRHFMHNLFRDATTEQQADYINRILNPLFFRCLNEQRNRDVFDTSVCNYGRNNGLVRIPYLNGGLFEQDPYSDIAVPLPAYFFSNETQQDTARTFSKTATPTRYPYDHACGLFDFFDRYNFTIDENDPDDAEVGVDPEMLGKIFENLLEDNKDKGAYYTPKEIVRYMCEESLIAYLETECPAADKADLRSFITTCSVPDTWLVTGADGQQLNTNGVEEALCNVKICDPAIGSGAFPMGLLNILYHCRKAIDKYHSDASKQHNTNADIKRHIIQHNIYGVDIEKGAVDIARLRFWLALIVDEQTPEALPNLDYKIMQGNSLLESYNGIDLSNLFPDKIAQQGSVQISMFEDELDLERQQLQKLLSEYYNTCDHTCKTKIKQQIKTNIITQLQRQHYSVSFANIDIAANNQFFLWHTWFSDVFNRSSKQGFDIVIGNPPYGAKLNNNEKDIIKNKYVSTKTIKGVQKGSMDTFTLFIELGYDIAHTKGNVAMIVPISITSSESASGIHRLLLNHCESIRVSSYAVRPQPVFEHAVVNTSIILFKKSETICQHVYSTKMYRKGHNFDLKTLIDNLQFVDVKDYLLVGRIPKISTSIELNILSKLHTHKKVKDYIRNTGSPIIYRFAGGRYFKVVTTYSNGSSAERTIYFDNNDIANCIGCILSSNLSFWFYQIYSDNLNWKAYEIEEFRIPPLSSEIKVQLNSLYSEYLQDIESNANIRQTNQNSSYNVTAFKEYKIGKSKSIIDKIDDLICPLYGLSKEETEFIKNYEIEFRLADE